MGSCVSVHKNPDTAMKLRLSVGSENEKILVPSPVKLKSDTVNGDVAVKPQLSSSRFRDDGSKEEAFFDSQPWMDSDCEDDFLSVNGDFTPSRGSTPVHHKFYSGNQQEQLDNKVEDKLGCVPVPVVVEKKKRLSELFKESLRRDQRVDDDQENAATDENVVHEKVKDEAKSGGGSSVSTEKSRVNGDDDESIKSGQCCLPRLAKSRSFSERKKKTTPSPARSLA